MKRALVLGATGHIGSHVVRTLCLAGIAVRALYRSETSRFVLDGLDVEMVKGALEDHAVLNKALRDCDWLFHCAGSYPSFTADRHVAIVRGLASVRDVFALAKETRLERIVFTSSASTVRRFPNRLATETDLDWPLVQRRSLYAEVKIRMEQEALRYVQEGLPIVIVNPSLCLGEYDTKPLSGLLILLVAKRKLPAYVDHVLNAIYTGDVGLGHLRAAERGRIGERYLLGHQNLTFGALAQLIASQAGVVPPRLRVSYPLAFSVTVLSELVARLLRQRPLIPSRAVSMLKGTGLGLDCSKAVRELGMPQTPLEEAIRRALAWFRQHGYL